MTGYNYGNILLTIGIFAFPVIIIFYLYFLFISKQQREAKLEPLFKISAWLPLLLTGGASLYLLWLFLNDIFQSVYVYNYSSADLHLAYKISGLWAGQSGSILFWQLMNALLSWFLIGYSKLCRKGGRNFRLYLGLILMVLQSFFFVLLVGPARPFNFFNMVPGDGSGLNPMLQSPGMIIHPPLTFIAYVAAAAPLIILLAGLLSKTDVFNKDHLFKAMKRWALLGWFTLTMGIIIGGQWAYYELGWGGYWDWDPVENASLLPWFLLTGLLHNMLAYKRFKLYKLGTALLAAGSFVLVFFSTFLTRSNILDSVHTFGSQALGQYLLAVIIFSIGFITLVFIWRRDLLLSEAKLDLVLSREGLILLTNITLLIFTIAVWLGTMFPVISELALDQQISLGHGFYNQITVFLGGLVVILMGSCYLLNWKTGSFQYKKHLPLLIFALHLGGLGVYLGQVVLDFQATATAFLVLVFLAAASLIAYLVVDIFRYVRQQKEKKGWFSLLLRSRKRRYSIAIIHLGFLVLFFGLTGASLEREYMHQLEIGETIQIEDYSLEYYGISESTSGRSTYYHADFNLTTEGRDLGLISSVRQVHPTFDRPYTAIGLHHGLWEDFYLILGGWVPDESVTIQVNINPLVRFVWLGSYIIYFATFLLLLPDSLFTGRGKDEA